MDCRNERPSRSWQRSRIACLMLMVAAWFLAPLPARAGTHRKTAPARGGQHAGYTVDLSNNWLETGGYRPIRIQITPHKAPASPRAIDVEILVKFRDQFYYADGDTLSITERIELPAGTTNPTTAVIWVPNSNTWGRFQAAFLENGKRIDRLTIEEYLSTSFNGDNLSAVMVLSQQPTGAGISHYDIGAYGNLQHPVIHASLAECPEEWIGLISCDVVCITHTDLRTLVQQHPKRWQALRQWVATGGNLWISHVPVDQANGTPINQHGRWNFLPEVETLLGVAPDDAAATEPLARGWRECVAGAFEELPGEPWRYPSAPVKPTEREVPEGKKLDFAVSRTIGQGVVVVATRHVAPDRDSTACAEVYRSQGAHRTVGSLRNGVSRDTNRDFWKFLVPGVGRAPVVTFLILITLFCGFIGPVNYFLLRRAGRLHLLIVTVPCVAGAVTMGLFGWALLTDGLGVKVRARTFTRVNQRTGDAVNWARLSYYAGLAPSGGLTFSRDVAVIPISASSDRSRIRRTFYWDHSKPDEPVQRLENGWLRSRMPMQLLTISAQKNRRKLEISQAADGPPVVKNLLGADVRWLLLCDEQGSQHYARDLARGATATLASADLALRMDEMARVLTEADLAAPPGVDPTELSRSSSYYYGYMEAGSAAYDDSIMERELSQLKALLQTHGSLPKRSYLAIVQRPPEIEYGLESFQEVASLHVIVGSY